MLGKEQEWCMRGDLTGPVADLIWVCFLVVVHTCKWDLILVLWTQDLICFISSFMIWTQLWYAVAVLLSITIQ